jgi:hypothetical protein
MSERAVGQRRETGRRSSYSFLRERPNRCVCSFPCFKRTRELALLVLLY